MIKSPPNAPNKAAATTNGEVPNVGVTYGSGLRILTTRMITSNRVRLVAVIPMSSPEAGMCQAKRMSCLLFVACLLSGARQPLRFEKPGLCDRMTVFEGARLITGDGSTPIENSAFIVENNNSLESAGGVSCRPRPRRAST